MSLSPIHADPLLADVSELLHRMSMCQTLAPFQWMAGDAIQKLQAYETKLKSGVPAVTHQKYFND